MITTTWWMYHAGDPWYLQFYSWFNIVEGCFWLLFAVLVTRRYYKRRHSAMELFYATAFFTFGLTDFRESYSLTTWLMIAKGLNLAILLGLRRYILRNFYPEQKTY